MYKNHLNEVIDLVNSKKLQAHNTYSNFDDAVNNSIQLISFISKSAMCFVIPWDDASGCKTIPEIVKLPYKSCWIESSHTNGVVNGLLCCQEAPNEIHVTFLQKDLKNPFALFGQFIIEDGHLVSQIYGFEHDEIKKVISWLTAVLSSLNCCNIKRIEHKPKPSQQSVRRALGRHPLFSTWTLEIDLVRSAKEIPGEGGTHASPRLHLRRGHARQHKPGHWCWVQACVVGDKSLGMIHKDYAAS
jgi:hypothetical protein